MRVDSFNKRVGELMKEVHDLRVSLEFTQREFYEFQDYNKTRGDIGKETKNDVETKSAKCHATP